MIYVYLIGAILAIIIGNCISYFDKRECTCLSNRKVYKKKVN